MPAQGGACEVALQGGKTKIIPLVMFQNKLDQSIAKAANSIVEDDWVGISFGQVTGFGVSSKDDDSARPKLLLDGLFEFE